MIDPVIRDQMEKEGPAQVRLRIGSGSWPSHLIQQANEWLREQDHKERQAAEDARAEEMALAREANALADSANSIALAASASAERSAVAALNNNKIAKAALAVAIIAMIISVVALFAK